MVKMALKRSMQLFCSLPGYSLEETMNRRSVLKGLVVPTGLAVIGNALSARISIPPRQLAVVVQL